MRPEPPRQAGRRLPEGWRTGNSGLDEDLMSSIPWVGGISVGVEPDFDAVGVVEPDGHGPALVAAASLSSSRSPVGDDVPEGLDQLLKSVAIGRTIPAAFLWSCRFRPLHGCPGGPRIWRMSARRRSCGVCSGIGREWVRCCRSGSRECC